MTDSDRDHPMDIRVGPPAGRGLGPLLAAGLALLASGCAVAPHDDPAMARTWAPPAIAEATTPASVDGRPDSDPVDDDPAGTGEEPPAADGETIAILWGKFRTHIALPDPDLTHALVETPAETPPADAIETPRKADAPPRTTTETAAPSTGPATPPSQAIVRSDLWDRIRAGFRIEDVDNARIDTEARWYSRHQDYLDRTIERARPYLHLIVSAIDERAMPMEIALLPIVESAFQPFAYSHGRAAGIWQFIPGTARRFGLKQDWWYDGRRDILASTTAALDYLQALNREFDGDWELALAAYNSGAGTVRKAIRRNRRRGRPTDFWHLRLPRETRAYVPKLLALKSLVADPDGHGIRLASIPDRPYLATVRIDSQIDLALAAELAGISLEEIYRLNPGFNRWATAPDGPHRLLLPVDRVARFEQGLARLPPERRIRWVRHNIRPGETLGHIARRYQTTVHVLTQVNKIRGHMIRAGDKLIVPVATRDIGRYTLSAGQRLKRLTSRPPARGRKKTVHRVRKGDTFWDLARRYGTTVRELAKWNGLSPKDVLRPGQRLVVWRKSGRTAVAGITDTAPSRKQKTRRILYVVKKGDSLARISQRFRVRISQLRHWNDLPRGRYLQPGQRLTLYVDVTRQTENI